MNEEFVTYELAVKLKALGFDKPCFTYYKDMKGEKVLLYDSMDFDGECNAPLFQQAFRWFREKYWLFHSTNYQDDNSGPGCFDYEILNKRGKTKVEDDGPEFKTYEEAELACLTKLIEIVENNLDK